MVEEVVAVSLGGEGGGGGGGEVGETREEGGHARHKVRLQAGRLLVL